MVNRSADAIGAVRLIISGRVQGVYYRDSAVIRAGEQGLYGWVRNLSDGRVEIRVQGAVVELDAFVKWCWQGPKRAQVEDIVMTSQPINGDWVDFKRLATASPG